ncbi:MAG: hypothetical protein LBN21_01345 [Treponema sp.]|jgi:hypothetical protein|nr:hypothetical protein [Treponema sp.]
MDEKMKKAEPAEDPYVSANAVTRQGIAIAGYFAGAVLILVMQFLGFRFFFIAGILGLTSLIIGLRILFAKDGRSKLPGIVLVAAGALCALSRTPFRFIRPITGTLLSICAVGFIALGFWNIIKLIKILNGRPG